MLPDPTVPPSLMVLLEKVGTFTAPSLRTFAALVTGLVAATGNRTVTGMLTAAGLSRAWSHDRAHAFFSRASWNVEVLGLALVEIAASMIRLLAVCHYERRLHIVADAAYHGKALRDLRENVTEIRACSASNRRLTCRNAQRRLGRLVWPGGG